MELQNSFFKNKNVYQIIFHFQLNGFPRLSLECFPFDYLSLSLELEHNIKTKEGSKFQHVDNQLLALQFTMIH